MNVTRRAGFWIALTLLGVGGAAAARAFFPVAFPTVAVELEMDRAAAIAAAGELARRYGWGEPDDRSAATFGVADRETQTYVELAGGGLEALERLAERGLYEPYQWRVRRFAEGRIEEVEVRFTPAGEPYGFELRLADDDPGEGNLDARAARALAEATATAWGIELVDYRLLESSEASLPSGRLDHELVFERTGETLGDARFRLRLRIAGERPAELTRFVFVPEAFSRRYADTRATNDAIGLAATTVYVLLFVLLGGGVGSALLLRRGWLEWRAPLRWGVVIATLLGLAQINGLPLAWMAYDTALSETSFVLQQLGAGVVVVLLGAPFVAFILMAGESLGRRAFPGHVRQWRFWSREVAASRTALGMTSAAYLLVGMQLGYVVLFYVTTRRLEGWWSPAEALVQPDLLATYLPWLQAVSLALFAAFWEESAFRAVPIACAALLGARFGKRGLWIAAAVVLQAVVFAAAHANYPQQPPYARVVELTLPALVWGCVYVAVGLVPTILAHFLYDLVLISLVLFASDARLDQAVIVLVGLAPLAVVLIARLRGPATARPPEWAYNRAWVPWRAREEAEPAGGVPAGPEPGDAPAAAPTAPAPGGVVPAPAAPAPHAPRREGPAALGARRAVAVAAAAGGIGLWAAAQASRQAPPRLEGTRARAEEVARAALRERGALVDGWTADVTTTAGDAAARAYVWSEAPGEFERLEGAWFGAPRWIVRFADWSAPPEQRAEEYRVWIGVDGAVARVQHLLPEGAPGARLDAEAARALALEAVRERLGLEPAELRVVEADEESRPERSDWTFELVRRGLLDDVPAEARVRVSLAGDEVVDVARYVRVPESWERERRRTGTRTLMLRGGLAALLAVGFGAAAVAAVVAWSRRRLPMRAFRRLSAAAAAAALLWAVTAWPAIGAGLSTAQPRRLQVVAALTVLAILVAIAVPAVGLVGALASGWLDEPRRGRERSAEARPDGRVPLVGAAWGLLLGGALDAMRLLAGTPPPTARVAGAAAGVPLLDGVAAALPPWLVGTAGLLWLLGLRARHGSTAAAQGAGWGLLIAVAVASVPEGLHGSLVAWAAAALVTAAVLRIGFRALASAPAAAPLATAALLGLQLLELSWTAPYPGARAGGFLALATLTAAALAWSRELEEGSAGRSDPVAGEARLGG